jgi:hypothetical protein
MAEGASESSSLLQFPRATDAPTDETTASMIKVLQEHLALGRKRGWAE